MEQLQSVEKEVGMLEASERELADLKDHLDNKKIEKSELNLKQEVGRLHPFFLPPDSFSISVSINNYPMPMTNLIVHNDMLMRSGSQVKRRSRGYRRSMRRWLLRGRGMTRRLRH